MGNVKEQVEKLLEDIKTERDHLSVQMHLAKADARDEWEDLERKWEHLRARGARVAESIGDTTEEVFDDLRIAGDDLRQGYKRLKNLLP